MFCDKITKHTLFSGRVTKVMTPIDYLKYYNRSKDSIKSTTIIPPKLGSNNLGSILVEFKNGSRK